ncbi:MAG: sulfur carrier protein ThiS [Helicobacteraceae bacterium]|nr:sulfur carrier protein ThiS [Helicobacteraceae bacterium]
MRLIINGEEKRYDQESLSAAELLKLENVELPDMVSMQVNDDFLKREEYDRAALKEGDLVNFLYFMGGGQSARSKTKGGQ